MNRPAHFSRVLRRLGVPGIVGAGVLLFCASAYFSAQRPLESRVAAAREALNQLEARRAREPRLAAQGGLQAFYGYFATGEGTEAWLARIDALAREHRIQLLQGAYSYSLPPGERLARYEITMPVSGDYRQIRRFLAALLNSIPVAALDRISFEKQNAADSKVEATLRLTLFLDARAERRP